MVTEVFPPNGQLSEYSAMIESSRFCGDPSLSPGEGRGAGSGDEATLKIFAGTIEWCISKC